MPQDSWYLHPSDGRAEILVRETGPRSAAPFVGLHGGWGAEMSPYIPLVTPLAGPQRRFVLYDQRGSLRSPVADPSALTVQQQIDDLEQLRQALGAEKLTLLAHSMGTYLAMA